MGGWVIVHEDDADGAQEQGVAENEAGVDVDFGAPAGGDDLVAVCALGGVASEDDEVLQVGVDGLDNGTTRSELELASVDMGTTRIELELDIPVRDPLLMRGCGMREVYEAEASWTARGELLSRCS